MSITLRLTALVLVAGLAACSQSSGSAANTVLDKENAAASVLKTRYKDVVMGTDVKGTTLLMYVDVDNMYSMSADDEAAMKADALNRWSKIWSSAHPHRHSLVRLSVRDYYGKEIYASSARV
jgi:hypothetical protein